MAYLWYFPGGLWCCWTLSLEQASGACESARGIQRKLSPLCSPAQTGRGWEIVVQNLQDDASEVTCGHAAFFLTWKRMDVSELGGLS